MKQAQPKKEIFGGKGEILPHEYINIVTTKKVSFNADENSKKGYWVIRILGFGDCPSISLPSLYSGYLEEYRANARYGILRPLLFSRGRTLHVRFAQYPSNSPEQCEGRTVECVRGILPRTECFSNPARHEVSEAKEDNRRLGLKKILISKSPNTQTPISQYPNTLSFLSDTRLNFRASSIIQLFFKSAFKKGLLICFI